MVSTTVIASGDINSSSSSFDPVIQQIVDYAYDGKIESPVAWLRAKATLLDALGAAFESIHESPECAALIGPSFPAPDVIPTGFKLPGTRLQLDLMKGAFDMGAMIRYLDHNDAFPGAEWGHPSDNLGAILATADIFARTARAQGDSARILTMKHVLIALMKAYEIQGCFQIKNAFNKVGLDHTILVKVASTAMVSWLMDLSKEQAMSAVSHAWMDGHPLRTYRQAPNTGPRKGWAAGDACMRAVHLAMLVKNGQPGAKTALTSPRWGFYDVLFKGNTFDLPRPFGSWVIENVIFKINTAEGHGMTAIEAALQIADLCKARGLDPTTDIASIRVRTQEAAMTIINKQGPLHNAADRDHCMKYMIAVVLLKGAQIETQDYQSDSPWANDPRVEDIRAKITMEEDKQFTRNYHDMEIRSITNALLVQLKDGTELPEFIVEYPAGHAKRTETLDLLAVKTKRNLELLLPVERVTKIMTSVKASDFEDTPVDEFIDLFVPS